MGPSSPFGRCHWHDNGPVGRRNADGGRRGVDDEVTRAFRPDIADSVGGAGADRVHPFFGHGELSHPAVQTFSLLPTAAGVHLNLADKRVRIDGGAFDRNISGVPLEPL